MEYWDNRLLNDVARDQYSNTIAKMWELVPDMMSRKIERANVQQAFVFDRVRQLYCGDDEVLSVGNYEDTAWAALVADNIPVLGIDPLTNGDTLNSFYSRTVDIGFDIIFSTSVIEHVENDEQFIDQICKLLNHGGYGVITMDFQESYKPGQVLPATAVRFYTKYDLEVRLKKILEANNCKYICEGDWTGEPDFWYQGHTYNLATMVFQKEI